MQEHGLLQMWEEMALPQMVYASKLAVGPAKVLLAFLAILLICAGGLALDYGTHSVVVCPNGSVSEELFETFSPINPEQTELAAFLQSQDTIRLFIDSNRGKCRGQGVFSTLWWFWTERFNDSSVHVISYIFNFQGKLQQDGSFGLSYRLLHNLALSFKSLFWAIQYHPFYSVVFLTYCFVILCIAGGGICRCAALEFAGSEKPGLFEALEFVYEKRFALISAPLIPGLLMTAFSLFLILIGFITNIPYAGETIVSVLLVFFLIIGLGLTLLLATSVAGTGLLFPAIAYEGSTGPDAIGRSICYVLTKPIWMIFYLVVQTFLVAFFYLVMRSLIFAVLWITYHSIRLGVNAPQHGPGKLERIWAEPSFFYLLKAPAPPLCWSEQVAGVVIGLLMLVITVIIVAMVMSFTFSSMTIIYALMRKKVDRVPVKKVWVHLESMQTRNPNKKIDK